MKGWVVFLLLSVLLYVLVVIQDSVGPWMAVFGAKPDLPVAFCLCVALNSRPGVASFWGFMAGFAHGAAAGANLTHYVLSRIAPSFGLAWVRRLDLQLSLPTAGLLVALGTLAAEVLLLLLAPPRGIGPALRDTITTAVYNGVLAIPLYGLVRLVFQPKAV
jgi:rod shape-determining protein MreD